MWRWEGDHFGSQLPQIEMVKLPLRHAGQYEDREIGLFYNYFRFYDPATGRYVENDPIGLQGGNNPYAYVTANPLKYLDAYGLEKFNCWATNTTGGGNGEITINGKLRKVCTYRCKGECTGTVTIQSHSSININGSEYCRGAQTKTIITISSQVSEDTTGFREFNIDTDSWYWDGWGRTEDIYNQLKKVQKEDCCNK